MGGSFFDGGSGLRVGGLRVGSDRVGGGSAFPVGSLRVGGRSIRSGRIGVLRGFCVSTVGGALRICSRSGTTRGLVGCGTDTSGLIGSDRIGVTVVGARSGRIGSRVTAPVFRVSGVPTDDGSGLIGVRSPKIFFSRSVGSSGAPLPSLTDAPIGTPAEETLRRGFSVLIELSTRPSNS